MPLVFLYLLIENFDECTFSSAIWSNEGDPISDIDDSLNRSQNDVSISLELLDINIEVLHTNTSISQKAFFPNQNHAAISLDFDPFFI